MIILISLAVVFVVLISISAIYNRTGNCKVVGNIKGLGTTIALVSGGTNTFNHKFFKLILVWNGKFSFKAGLKEPGGGRFITRSMFFKRANGKPLAMRSQIIDFKLNPDEYIRIEGEIKPYVIDYVIKGNTLSEQSTQFRQQALEILAAETKTTLFLQKLKAEGTNREGIRLAQEKLSQIQEDYNNQKLTFALAHPSYEIAASFLNVQNKANIIKYFPALTDKVKQTPAGKLLQERIKAWGQVETGKAAPAIVSTTLAGTAFNLEDLKGKYVVLDFWGSWCGPCISGFPKMKDYYHKYQDRLEFVGIAYGDREAAWKKAVEKYLLTWPQLLNKQDDNFHIIYAVDKFPTKILIDQAGNLVQIFAGESGEFYQQLDKLFTNQAATP